MCNVCARARVYVCVHVNVRVRAPGRARLSLPTGGSPGDSDSGILPKGMARRRAVPRMSFPHNEFPTSVLELGGCGSASLFVLS